MKYAPVNLEECFSILKNDLSAKDLTDIAAMDQKQLCRLHHNLGRWIRNNFGLWERGPLNLFFLGIGIAHPDDMSGIIIESFWHHLKNEPLELEKQIKFYQDFWKKSENQ